MKLELEVYGSYCATSKFVINGVEADYDDFGSKFDHDQENAPDYGCGDMQFDPDPPTSEVLAKYNINEAEYAIIANQLQELLSFGNCGWCV
jgi:hypothetical protein